MNLHEHGFIKLIPLEEAVQIVKNSIPNIPLNSSRVNTVDSLGRILSEDIISEKVLPDRNSSAMDGYALRSRDIKDASKKNPVKLRIKGELYPADYPTNSSIDRLEAIYVACGAPIPEGADTVIRIERIKKSNNHIFLTEPAGFNRNICSFGEDVKIKDIVIKKGSVIRPPEIGMLVALNREFVNVTRKPVVAIISVGDELVQPFKSNEGGIINNNAYIVSNLSEYFGSESIKMGIAKDTIEDISRLLKKAISKADLVLTIAGCSIGKKDFVPDALNSLDGHGIKFHGIAISSGKVCGFGLVKNKPVIMLPGFIGSTISAFYLIVLPLLNMWRGLGFSDRLPTIQCVIDEIVKAKPGLKKILPVRIYKKNGEYHASASNKPLSVLNSYIESNGFITLPAGQVLEKGEIMDVKIFGGLELYNLTKIK